MTRKTRTLAVVVALGGLATEAFSNNLASAVSAATTSSSSSATSTPSTSGPTTSDSDGRPVHCGRGAVARQLFE